MPRPQTGTSNGSPGTSRIATNVTNISATNVGRVSAILLKRYFSTSFHIDAVELVRAERALLESGHALAHGLVDDRMRHLHVGRFLVIDHLHLAVELLALLLVREGLRL